MPKKGVFYNHIWAFNGKYTTKYQGIMVVLCQLQAINVGKYHRGQANNNQDAQASKVMCM